MAYGKKYREVKEAVKVIILPLTVKNFNLLLLPT